MGDVLSKGVGGLSTDEASHIKAVALIADPRFNSKEPFATGRNLRPGHSGVLGARSPGDVDIVKGKIRSWCRRSDIVCQGLPGTPGDHRQENYYREYGEAVVDFLAGRLGWPKRRLYVVTELGDSCNLNNTPTFSGAPRGCLASRPESWTPIRLPDLGTTLSFSNLRWSDWGAARAYASGRAAGCGGGPPCRDWSGDVSLVVHRIGWGDCCYVEMYYCLTIRRLKAYQRAVGVPVGIDALPDRRSKC